MSRHRGRLKAALSDDRNDVLCGACGQRLAGVRRGVMSLHWSEAMRANEPRVVAFDVRGWKRADDGVWRVGPEDLRDFMLGRRPVLRKADARFPRNLPARAECPHCGARQTVDPGRLDVSANNKTGTIRLRSETVLKAIDNPGWCAAHGCASEGHGKHDVPSSDVLL